MYSPVWKKHGLFVLIFVLVLSMPTFTLAQERDVGNLIPGIGDLISIDEEFVYVELGEPMIEEL